EDVVVGGLDVAAEPIRIEQHASVTMIRELAPNGSQQLAIGSELAGERLVFLEAAGDELGQSDGVQQTASHASRECIAPAGEQRQTHKERIAAGRVRVVGQR